MAHLPYLLDRLHRLINDDGETKSFYLIIIIIFDKIISMSLK